MLSVLPRLPADPYLPQTVVLPKSVTPSRVEENFKGECSVVSVGKGKGLM